MCNKEIEESGIAALTGITGLRIRLNILENTVTSLDGKFFVWIQHGVPGEKERDFISLLVTRKIPSSFAPPNIEVSEIHGSESCECGSSNKKPFCWIREI